MFIAFYILSCAQDLLGIAKEKLPHRNQFWHPDSGSTSTPLSVPVLLKDTEGHSDFVFAGLRSKGTSASQGQSQHSRASSFTDPPHNPVSGRGGRLAWNGGYAGSTPLTLKPCQVRATCCAAGAKQGAPTLVKELTPSSPLAVQVVHQMGQGGWLKGKITHQWWDLQSTVTPQSFSQTMRVSTVFTFQLSSTYQR